MSSPEQRHLNRFLKKNQQLRNGNAKRSSKGRVLISVNIAGSTGPIRLLVNEEDHANSIIRNVLKVYRHEGRLPVLGTNANDLCLYCPNIDRVLGSRESVGAHGCRNLLLCVRTTEKEDRVALKERKESGNWKSWLNKSLNIIISSP